MSNMLKEAIVDATALKQVAEQNASALLLEKYSMKIKEAVNAILEAPTDEEEGDPNDLTDNTPGGMDALGGEGDGVGTMGMDDGVEPGEPSRVAGNSPMAALDGQKMCNCPEDDEEIEIDFGDLQSQMAAGSEGGDQLGNPVPSSSIDVSMSGAAPGEETDDEYSLREEDVAELAEELKVDVEPVKSGWRDSSITKQEDNTIMALAHEQDDEVKEEREKMVKALKDLEESKKTLKERMGRLISENKEIKALLRKVKVLLEQTSKNNAKLLYTNKALMNVSLNERQKRTIAESLSKAESVENARVIYETFLSSAQVASVNRNPQSLNEAVQRGSANVLMAGRQQKDKPSANPQIERMQKLAGIRKVSDTTKKGD